MRLNARQKAYLAGLMQEKFALSTRRAFRIAEDVQRLLLHDDYKFIYDLHYMIFVRKNFEFTHNVLNLLINSYVYLYGEAGTEEERRSINAYLNKVFDILFIQRCAYSRKVEERAKTAQNILIHVSNKLNEVLNTQEMMIANISHEMRTSLNAIYGYLSIIDGSNVLQGEEKYYLQKANHATMALQSLVKDILNVTKINSGQLEIQKEFFWLDSMVLKCVDNISMNMKKKENIAFHMDVDFLPFKVYGDQAHIMEILINLLSNAFKYTQRGHIRFGMRHRQTEEGIEVVFSVEDSGIGMTPEQVEEIFNPYSRFKTEEQGLGLGLHITKQLSERLNGKLGVESTEGEGSTFRFSLFFDELEPAEINLEGKQICLFINDEYREMMQAKLNFLESRGALLHSFDDEAAFINHLLSLKSDPPKIVLISTSREEYAKFDALNYYLKSTNLYSDTYFIAENIHQQCSLKYFDEIFEYFAPIETYEKLVGKKAVTDENGEIDLSILVIDDTETNLDIFKLFVSKKYPEVVVDLAGGGYEGIGMFKIKDYDIVFVDLKMPGLSGFDVLKKLQTLGNNLPPIYAFSADVYKSNFEKVHESGFSGLLEKPLQPEMLYKIIQRIIDEKNRR